VGGKEMSTPKKIYIIVNENREVDFWGNKRKDIIEPWEQYAIDENMSVFKLMDWLADGLPENEEFERVL
jgi:hypothetical protein